MYLRKTWTSAKSPIPSPAPIGHCHAVQSRQCASLTWNALLPSQSTRPCHPHVLAPQLSSPESVFLWPRVWRLSTLTKAISLAVLKSYGCDCWGPAFAGDRYVSTISLVVQNNFVVVSDSEKIKALLSTLQGLLPPIAPRPLSDDWFRAISLRWRRPAINLLLLTKFPVCCIDWLNPRP